MNVCKRCKAKLRYANTTPFCAPCTARMFRLFGPEYVRELERKKSTKKCHPEKLVQTLKDETCS